MDYKNLKTLGVTILNADASAPTAYSWGEEKFSYDDLNDTFRNELNTLYQENPKMAFKLVEEAITDVLPKKVMEQYKQFAETKTYAQGDRPIFTQRITEASKKRAKKFITQVGLAGRYEVFKLDGRSYEVQTNAIGGAVQASFEEILDGRVTLADFMQIAMEGLDEAVLKKIANALSSFVKTLPRGNAITAASFSQQSMDDLLSVADAYGKATIYCTYEFAAQMLPNNANWVSNEMKNTVWQNGYLGNYKGHQVVILDQSFEDETNLVKVLDPSIAYIIPTGTEKPVKIAFEGTMHMREVPSQDDWSSHIDFYQKMGVAAIATNNNICVYKNTSLSKVRDVEGTMYDQLA